MWRTPVSGYLRGVGQAILFGVIASSALVLGALVGGRLRLPSGLAALAFAAGHSSRPSPLRCSRTPTRRRAFGARHSAWRSGRWCSPWSARLDRMAEGHRKDDHGGEKLDLDAAAQDAPASQHLSAGRRPGSVGGRHPGWSPENLVLGVALGEGSGGIALLAAIFVANFPEALVGSASMREQGRSRLSSWAPGLCARCCWSSPWFSVPDHCRERRTRRSRYLWPLPRAPSSRHSPTRSCQRPTSMAARPSLSTAAGFLLSSAAAVRLTARRHPGARLGCLRTATPSTTWHSCAVASTVAVG